MTQTQTRKAVPLAALVVAAVACVWLISTFGGMGSALSNDEFIARECAALNKKTPMHIDGTTDVVRIDPIPGKGMRFKYVLAQSVRNMATKEMVHEQLIPRYTEESHYTTKFKIS